MIIPKRLEMGDEIRVVSPSSSMTHIGGLEANQAAKDYLENLGYKVTFGRHIHEHDMLESASIASRVADLHEAFLDDKVKMVLATIGGFNSNELLPYLDYDLIKAHPKLICGYSDSTAFLTAIQKKTGLITYMGPSFSSFKMKEGQDYQCQMWLKAVTGLDYELEPSEAWSSDPWYLPDHPRDFKSTEWKVYNHGQASGTITGGNLSTFSLLRGTPYFPQVAEPIVFVEEAEEDDYLNFDRALAALLQAIERPKALLIGRFPRECEMTEELLLYILDKFPVLKEIPVMYDLDFAHTQPLFTIPIGAKLFLDTGRQKLSVSYD